MSNYKTKKHIHAVEADEALSIVVVTGKESDRKSEFETV
jgi:hypothetical protein